MAHHIHNIRFWDIKHLHDSIGQYGADERREFHSKGKDVLRQRIVSSDREYTQDSYNKQLIYHNKLHSKVVSEFITNSEMIVQHLHNLPHHDLVNKMNEEASSINGRFSLMQD
jgi:hypothetical protein